MQENSVVKDIFNMNVFLRQTKKKAKVLGMMVGQL
jgi:hypothetical protein